MMDAPFIKFLMQLFIVFPMRLFHIVVMWYWSWGSREFWDFEDSQDSRGFWEFSRVLRILEDSQNSRESWEFSRILENSRGSSGFSKFRRILEDPQEFWESSGILRSIEYVITFCGALALNTAPRHGLARRGGERTSFLNSAGRKCFKTTLPFSGALTFCSPEHPKSENLQNQ